MKYATFGADGKLNGRYDSAIHSVIPNDAVAISDALFFETINTASGHWERVNGAITYVPPPDPVPPTAEEEFAALVKKYDAAVEAHLHAEATAHGYTNIERACMYSSYPNPYWEESKSFVAWVGAVWAYCFEQVEWVRVGLRPVPTIPQIISELPIRIMPNV